MIEKIKQIKFTTVIIFLAVIIVILLILQALFSTSNQTRPGSELVVPGVDQTASFERYEATGTGSDLPVSPSNRVVIKIYVESIGDLTTPMFTALKREALAREGLTEDQVYFVLVEYNDLEQEEDYLRPYTDSISVDPTDPSTFSVYGNSERKDAIYKTEPIVGMTFEEYVEITKPATSNYEIYKDAPQQYTVVLKGGYTREQFEEDLLSNFPESSSLQITYVNRDDLRN